MTLSAAALARFNTLFKSGVAYRTALALAADADTLGTGGGGGGTGTVTSVNGKSPVAGAVTLVKGDIGLGSVDNTSDVAKPVSTAQSAAINAAINGLINSAPGTLDTLGEIATQLASDETAAGALTTTVAGKLAKSANLSDLASIPTAKGNLALVKADVGLANVDNTSDANKPVSTAQAAADTAAANNAKAASWSLNPVQRGVWAPATVYSLGDIAISPTGDIITPKVPFTSGGAYSAANWNILVPAQNYGRELCGAESNADLNLLPTAGAWTDVPGCTGTIPAGIPFTCEITALCASLQGTMAAGSITGVQLRVVDAATATTVYGFAWRQFSFPVAGQSQTRWDSVAGFRRQAALGSSTAVKLQAIGAVATGAGNIGLFPASGGSTEPTTFVVRGR